MSDKEALAQRLAEAHYRTEPGIIEVLRILNAPNIECRPDEPIKLLEVNSQTIPSGIMPLHFGPEPSSGVLFPTTIVEITPEEFVSLKQGVLLLPQGWRLGDVLARPCDMVQPSA